MNEYLDFIEAKSQLRTMDGFRPTFMPGVLKDFQAHLVDWSVQMGRSAIFADCGLGKTLMELVWAENVVRHTNKPVLILAPLAVSQQTMREAEKFGLDAALALNGHVSRGINIVNYERLHYFDPNIFAGCVCDESAILKSFDGTRRREITDFMKKMRYRLLGTATAAPNEYIELGTSSEALGYLGYMDMLSRFFKNNQGNSIKPHMARKRGPGAAQLDDNAKWRFKGHAERAFWQWVCSWARACRKPSDLGYTDTGYDLPPLIEQQHMVDTNSAPDGMLFSLPAIGLSEQRAERRRTIEDRCAKAAQLVNGSGEPGIVWCHLNDEGDLLESLIPDCVQVSGKDSEDEKEEKLLAFLDGKARVLVTKGKIGAWGLNFQHCAHSVSFPTHSFEEYYQSIRRCWRFGQTRPVRSDIITTEGEKSVLANLQRKSEAADKMFSQLVQHMTSAHGIDRDMSFINEEEIPSWL